MTFLCRKDPQPIIVILCYRKSDLGPAPDEVNGLWRLPADAGTVEMLV
jgi:hypothetical protein